MRYHNIITYIRKRTKGLMQPFLTFTAMVLIGFASYSFGLLQGAGLEDTPLVIAQGADDPVILCSDACTSLSIAQEATTESEARIDVGVCPFVGSVNGTKFYPPDCSGVNRISPENLRCFSSEDEAYSLGYEPASSCS